MRTPRLILAVLSLVFLISPLQAGQPVTVTVHPASVLGPISPLIYGTNQTPTEGSGTSVWRLGGNRMTGYNWETNYSNAGNDWKHSSDDWLCSGAYHLTDCDEPSAVYDHFVENAKERGMDSIVTLPIVDFVTADKDGSVAPEEKAPSKRWVKNLPVKKGAPKFPPNREDNAVYQNEAVAHLTKTFGDAKKGGVRFYSLDNEPALWNSTHPRLHPELTRYDEMVDKTERFADMITRMDPGALVLGAVCYGWQEFQSLQNAPDSAEHNAKFGTYLDYFLDQMARLEREHKRRLVHILDLHFYPEAQGGGKRITEGDISPESIEARLQAPRSLWDPTYVEKSWITQHSTGGKPIRLFPWVKEKIDKWYPNTRLAMTEYDYGAQGHISGGLAQADVLGVYGREGVYLACLWAEWKDYTTAAFKLYRSYDGKGGRFGDQAVAVEQPDPARFSVYASTDPSRPGTLWVVVIHKDLQDAARLRFSLDSTQPYTTFQSYGFGKDSAEVKPVGQGAVKEGVLEAELPPLSATLFVVQP
jgi:mannan endo-1,4-beta-mannosidase